MSFPQKKLVGSGKSTGLTEQKFAWSHHCPALLSFPHGNYLSDVQRGSLKNGNLARCRWDVSELTAGAKDSGALPRISGPATDFVKGSINNHPFRRRVLDDSESFGMMLPDGASNGEWVWEMLNGGPAQAIPPSFKEGLDLGDLKKAHPFSWNVYEGQSATENKSEAKLWNRAFLA